MPVLMIGSQHGEAQAWLSTTLPSLSCCPVLVFTVKLTLMTLNPPFPDPTSFSGSHPRPSACSKVSLLVVPPCCSCSALDLS